MTLRERDILTLILTGVEFDRINRVYPNFNEEGKEKLLKVYNEKLHALTVEQLKFKFEELKK
jgi:hypothetical protein|tara:strand:- start:56 stop:241 length:186 start_codon:yes stop_codon:yes gene_type:complete